MNQDSPPHHHSTQQTTLNIQKLTIMHTQISQILQQNTNLRMKYPDQPQKFYQSQENLNNIIQQLSQHVNPQLISIMMESAILSPLIRVLDHPNVDLGIGVIEFMHELLQEQPTEDKLFEHYFRMGIWLIENNFIESILAILVKLDQENSLEEYETGLKILKLVEMFTNLHDSTYQVLTQDKKIIAYLANRIMPNFKVNHKVIDDNKYVSTDILIALLTNSEKAQAMFSAYSGVEILLQGISVYETKLPEHTDQKQSLSNMFSCLSVLLINHTLSNNKKSYHQLKGNYLMISFLKSKSQFSALALKVTANSFNDIGLTNETLATHQVIQDGGLKYIFAIFRRKGIRGQDFEEQKSIDGHLLILIYSLVRSSEDVFRDRVEHKLADHRFENTEKLFQLRAEYAQNVGPQLQSEVKSSSEYLSRLEEGLSYIEQVDKIILTLVQRFPRFRAKLKNLMQLYGLKVRDFQKSLSDHYNYLGLEGQKQYVQYLLSTSLQSLKGLFPEKQIVEQRLNTLNSGTQKN